MKFRIVAAAVLVIVLFGCYVVAKNMSQDENSAVEEPAEQSNYGGLGK